MKKNNTAYTKRHLKVIASAIIAITIAAVNCFTAEAETGTPQNNQGKTSYNESAEQNYNLAVKYDNEKNYAEAAKYYKKAADQGDSDAQTDLGYIYFHGKGFPQDYSEAAKWYWKASEQGNAEAQFSLGNMYLNGQGVYQNYAEAAKWYRKAAEQDNADAQCNLGYMYEHGYGVNQDDAEAATWYLISAEQGNLTAQNNIGIAYGDAIAKGYKLDSTQYLIKKYLDEKDYEGAAFFIKRLANKGDVESQVFIGQMYNEGVGVNKDYAEAFRWFKKAADNGSAEAQYNLGIFYFAGQRVEKNNTEAKKWFSKAAEQGYEAAKRSLEILNQIENNINKD